MGSRTGGKTESDGGRHDFKLSTSTELQAQTSEETSPEPADGIEDQPAPEGINLPYLEDAKISQNIPVEERYRVYLAKTASLKFSAVNSKIYADQDDEAFYESIKERGVLTPLVITEEREVVSGNRRLKNALKAELDRVPVIFITALDKIDKKDLLLLYNFQREKTAEDKWNEAQALKEVYEAKKLKGRRTRYLAKAVGLGSSRTFERLDHIMKTGNRSVIDKINAGSMSINAAYEKVIGAPSRVPSTIKQNVKELTQKSENIERDIQKLKQERNKKLTKDPSLVGPDGKAFLLNGGKFNLAILYPNWDYQEIGLTHPGPKDFDMPMHPVMDSIALSGLEVDKTLFSDMGEDQSMVCLFVPSRLQELAYPVLQAWGYEHAGNIFWCRNDVHEVEVPGLVRDKVSVCLIGVRGEFNITRVDNWFSASAPPGSLPQMFFSMLEDIYNPPNEKTILMYINNKIEGCITYA